MSTDHPELDEMQQAYRSRVERWIAAIRKEEELASANHSVAQVDRWEQAHDAEETARHGRKRLTHAPRSRASWQ